MPESAERMVDVGPAKLVRGMVSKLLHWFLPDSQQHRFSEIGERYSYLDSHGWEKAFQMTKPKLQESLRTLKGWVSRPETDELMDSWDDEVMFFYVLHFQRAWINMHRFSDDQLIPGSWNDFWEWAMVVRDDESWLDYTFPTVVDFQKLNPKPKIWRFFAPSDVKIS